MVPWIYLRRTAKLVKSESECLFLLLDGLRKVVNARAIGKRALPLMSLLNKIRVSLGYFVLVS